MQWAASIHEAVSYIEDHLTAELTVGDIAKKVHMSPFYFQKGFALLCGFTVSEYIRNRRLACAAAQLLASDTKIIDIAVKYGYDSPDSFTKAFTRFHGVTPSMARKKEVTLKSFAPLKINLSIEGGAQMDYKIVQKDSFTVSGVLKTCGYEHAETQIPNLWATFLSSQYGAKAHSLYGINMDKNLSGEEFDYLIGGDYDPSVHVPQEFTTKEIPAFTWAVFPCKGKASSSMSKISGEIFSQWLPACREYEIAAGYCVEWYDDPANYAHGINDNGYYAELWIPVKKKG